MTLWQKYRSNFSRKQTEPIEKSFGKFEGLSDSLALVLNWNEFFNKVYDQVFYIVSNG